MGTRQVTIRFCDCCSKQIAGRLTLHTCPCCGKDICVECQEKEDSKHRPRERKAKVEQGNGTVPLDSGTAPMDSGVAIEVGAGTRTIATITEPKRKRGKPTQEVEEIVDKKGDNLTIHVPTGLGGDTDYKVKIGKTETTGATLKLTVLGALDEWDGKIPDFLSEDERKTIQNILDA